MARGERGSMRWHRGGWELRVQVDGRRRTKRFNAPNTRSGRSEATAALDAWISTVDNEAGDMTVAEAIEAYRKAKAAGWSPSTRAAHGYHANPAIEAFGDKPLPDLDHRTIQRTYERWLDEGTSAGTVRRRHSLLAAALNYAERQGWILKTPMVRVELPKTPRTPTDLPSAKAVATAISKLPKSQRRLQVFATLALATGARRGELCALRWSDIDHDAKTVRIVASIAEGEGDRLERKGTKSGSVRTIAVDGKTLAMMKAWRSEQARQWLAVGVALADNAPVFSNPTDPTEPIKPSRIAQDWRRHRAAIGLPAMRFHDLRHRHATSLLEAGIPVHEVSRRLGHGSPTITLSVYAHAIPERDERSARAIAKAMEVG